MRQPAYISPSSLGTFEKDPEEYYLKYLADVKPPRLAQTQPMSVGSAFDAYIKSDLNTRLFGTPKAGFEFETLFESQVEAHNRDWAREAGRHVFESYKASGAARDLMADLETSLGEPQFEFELTGMLETAIGGVPISGKPDVFYITKHGGHVVLDWKVNGYCGKSATSPAPGYISVRDGWADGQYPASRNCGMHKDCTPAYHNGVLYNKSRFLEDVQNEWAKQLTIYGWMLGEPVGTEDCIKAIDQIVSTAKPDTLGYPLLRIASHRLKVSATYQYELLGRITDLWNRIINGHFFTDRTLEESQARCAQLDDTASALVGDGSDDDQWFSEITRKA